MQKTKNRPAGRVDAHTGFLIFWVVCVFAVCASCGLGDPNQDYYNIVSVTDDIRGIMFVSELHWAGSVKSDGSDNRPDDCYIEIFNSDLLPRSLKGWSLRFSDEHGKTIQLINLTNDDIIPSLGRYTIGKDNDGAFLHFDYLEASLFIPHSRFRIEVQDAGGRVSDTVDFTKRDYLPGSALPNERRSIVRYINAFNQPDANGYESWYVSVLHPVSSQVNIHPDYRNSVFCAPGKLKGSQYMWNPGVGNNGTLAFIGSDFEGGTVGGSGSATLSYVTDAKIGSGAMRMRYNSTTSGGIGLWVSPSLLPRGKRNLLTFWAKGTASSAIRLFFTTSNSSGDSNRFYDFRADDSGLPVVSGEISATISAYALKEIRHDAWTQFILALGPSSWYGGGTGNFNFRLGGDTAIRNVDMYFDDFRWVSYDGDEEAPESSASSGGTSSGGTSSGGASSSAGPVTGPEIPPTDTVTTPTLAFAGADFESVTVPGSPSTGAEATRFAYTLGNASFGSYCLKIGGAMTGNGNAYSVALGVPGAKTKISMWVRGTSDTAGSGAMFMNFNNVNYGTFGNTGSSNSAEFTIWKLSSGTPPGYGTWENGTGYTGAYFNIPGWTKISRDMSTQTFYTSSTAGLNGSAKNVNLIFRAQSGARPDFYVDNIIYED